MLSNCNTLSVSRLKVAGQQFKNYKQLLLDIQKDLDYTFKKICVLKSKLQSQYPESISGKYTLDYFSSCENFFQLPILFQLPPKLPVLKKNLARVPKYTLRSSRRPLRPLNTNLIKTSRRNQVRIFLAGLLWKLGS